MAEDPSAAIVRELRQLRLMLGALIVLLALMFMAGSLNLWMQSHYAVPQQPGPDMSAVVVELQALRNEVRQQRNPGQLPTLPGPLLAPAPQPAGNPAKAADNATLDGLMKAADDGQVGKVEQLFKDGINVNERDADGQTALMHAAAKGQAGVAQVLIDHKALMAEQDKFGQTAAMKAAKSGHRPILLMMKDRHKENEQHNTIYQLWAIRDKEGRTALMYAAMEGHTEIVEDLLYAMERDDVSHPSIKDNQGKTALMYAAECGHSGVVKVMLSSFFKVSPAYVGLKDPAGKTALQLAEEKGHKDIVALLKM
jgi:ankyrin repeat protein